MRQSIVLAGLMSFVLASAALAAGMGTDSGSGAASGRSSGADQSGTHDTGVGTDQKLNVGPGAKSATPVDKDQPDKMSNPD